MKTAWIAALVTGLALALTAPMADAKRLGGGKSTGMQRATPDKPAQPSTPPQSANPAATPNAPAAAAAPNAGAAAAAAAPKRSWLGPVAGLAAGLGLAALASHLGFGEELANVMMIVLLAIVAVVVLRFVMRRFAGGAAAARSPYAMAGAGAGAGSNSAAAGGMARQSLPLQPAGGSAGGSTALATTSSALPAGFDAAAFERIAKMIFIRLQAAHDAADLNDLRGFTTPEMFASVRLDLQDRGAAPNKTDVVTVNAELLDFAQESDRQIVSVRYSGLIREEQGAVAQPFDEVWHLVRPADGSRDWAIAGIQQRQ